MRVKVFLLVAVLSVFWWRCFAGWGPDGKFTYKQYGPCRAKYSDGSLPYPCGFCDLCFKNINKTTNEAVDMCIPIKYKYKSAIKNAPLVQSYYVPSGAFCKTTNYCQEQSACRQKCGSRKCIELYGGCKCTCDNTEYGQFCQFKIPNGLTPDSFADVHSILFSPLVYVNDYVKVVVYMFNTGVNFIMDVKTDSQHLTFDSRACKRDVPPGYDSCAKLFNKATFVYPYDKECTGGRTYKGQDKKDLCAVIFRLEFTRDKVLDFEKEKFVLEYEGVPTRPKNYTNVAVAKFERVDVTINNSISGLVNQNVFYSRIGFVVVYSSKIKSARCPVYVTIPQFSKRMELARSFPRKSETTVSNKVVFEDETLCQNMGDPTTNWQVWKVDRNFDESNPTIIEKYSTPILFLPSFSLPIGFYMVKTEVKFSTTQFVKADAYCYFRTVLIPFQPLVEGGTVRYVYYKSPAMELTSHLVIDLNYPWDKQPVLEHHWTCNDTADDLCKLITTKELVVTYKGPFKPKKTYYFKMTINNPEMHNIEQTRQVVIMSEDAIPNLLINCLRNCGGKNFKSNTREQFYFIVEYSKYSIQPKSGDSPSFIWTYTKGNGTFIDVQTIRQEEHTPSHILIVDENKLENNERYTFKVVGGGDKPGEAQLNIETFKYTAFSCKIAPEKGIAGLTKFDVECSKPKFEDSEVSLTITFYDKYNENDTTGRLVGSNYVESLAGFVLTRGTLVVYATNLFGHYQTTHVKAKLTSPEINDKFLEESMKTLYAISENEGSDQKLSFISSLCDILNKDPKMKDKVEETLLKIVSKEDATDLVNTELILTTAQSIVCDEENCSKANLSDTSYSYLGQIMADVTEKLTEELSRTTNDSTEFPTYKINVLYTTFLKCAGVLVTTQQALISDTTLETINFAVYELYRDHNLKMVKSLNNVNRALAKRNLPFAKHSSVQTEFIETWRKEDVPSFFTNGTKGKYNGSYIQLSESLAGNLAKKYDHLAVQVTDFTYDPFWWAQTENVGTQVISLEIGVVTDNRNFTLITGFKSPGIDIYLKKSTNFSETISGQVTQPKADEDDDKKDLAVAVHRMFPQKGAKLSVKFINLSETDSFMVKIVENLRPDYAEVRFRPCNVDIASDSCSIDKVPTDKDDIVYIGILPGKSVKDGKTLNYSFELESARCQVWYDFLWAYSHCRLGPNSTSEFLHCQCTHLSSIAGFLGVPLNTIDPFKDYKLFMDIPDNPYVFSVVLSINLIFILLLILIKKMDKKDLRQSNLIVLKDNLSGDLFGYLVIVFTGSRLFAGTTSHIGIVLHGSLHSSRSHILGTSSRPTLRRDSDDWFVIFSPNHLGILSSVQLWTDHHGCSPNWFCDKIIVHDLTTKRDYTFLLGKWFGVTLTNLRVESFARPIELDKQSFVSEFFLTNLVLGFRESHAWFSILGRHPRSPVTRSERLSLAVVALIITLLLSILFYDAVMPQEEDPPHYNVSAQEALIGLYSLLVAAAATSVVYIAFKKSYVYKEEDDGKGAAEKRQSSRIRVDAVASLKTQKQAERNVKFYFKKALLALRKETYEPIKIGSNAEKTIVVRKKVLILAWFLCFSIIFITSFFIVWIGLKIGKNKSLMWLTSTGMAFGEDFFVVDPTKIIVIAFLFGLAETQFCDVCAYDSSVYKMRKEDEVKRFVDRDLFISKLRLNRYYKPMSIYRQNILYKQHKKVKKWWSLIDVLDICFALVAAFLATQHISNMEYYLTNSALTNTLFRNIETAKIFKPCPLITSANSYLRFLQNSVFPGIYSTSWYNKESLTSEGEVFPKTGWAKTLTHRLIGIPRLRQIRTVEKACTKPRILRNVSYYCNILYNPSTEDDDDYGTQWAKGDFEDVIFEKSPWKYHSREDAGYGKFFQTYAESRRLFHSGGYIAELKRTRRESSGELLNLNESRWLDLRTRIVFFELSTYNVNDNVFSSIMFDAEHFGSSLLLAGSNIWSIMVVQRDYLLELVYFVYAIFGLAKLIMLLNVIGPRTFFTSFWNVFDLVFIAIGMMYFIGRRVFIELLSQSINALQKSGKDVFFDFEGLMMHTRLDIYFAGLLLVLATIRTLRLLKYGLRVMSVKFRYTLYFSWPQVLNVTVVLATLSYVLQTHINFLVFSPYPLCFSHYLQHKMNFPDLQTLTNTKTSPFLLYLACLFSVFAMVFYVMILINAYVRANTVYTLKKESERVRRGSLNLGIGEDDFPSNKQT